MKDQNELQAMRKDPPTHLVLLAQKQSTIETKDRTHVLDLDMLSMYDQDVLFLLVFCCKRNASCIGVCESFSPCCIKIDVSEGTLPIVSKVGIKEAYDDIQIGHGPVFPVHFSPGVTTDNDL